MTFSPREGATVGGPFRLVEHVASGGFATVWRATDVDSGETVAVKCGDDTAHGRDEVRTRFRRECRWFRRFEGCLTPGALVQFVDGSVNEDAVYVATELVDGPSLDEYFDEAGRSPGLAAFEELAPPICQVIDFLHRNGVCYLDLKPSNVLTRSGGPPALVDLNTAVAVDEGTGTLFHHDAFRPPELTPTDLRDEPASPWSDVYSLGALLAYLLTGRAVEFADASLEAWQALDPRSLGADCPDSLAAAIRTATEPAPDDRFATAGELLDAISSHFDGPDRSAVLTHSQTGTSIRVRPGATVGRWTPGRPVPTVVLDDDARFVSPEHAVLSYEAGDWNLWDRSLNGTFVRTDSGWRYVLSADGMERRRATDRSLPHPDPVDSVRLADGDRIDPVDPEYGIELAFRTTDG